MRRNTLLALVTWLMVVAFFVVAATAAGRMKAMEHEIDSLRAAGLCGREYAAIPAVGITAAHRHQSGLLPSLAFRL